MADRISDEAFEAMPLSQQLEFAAAVLHDTDEKGLRTVNNEAIMTALTHCVMMARSAKALERELAQRRDDERMQVLRLEIAWEQAEAPDSNVVSWPVIARKVRLNMHSDNPKGAA